MLEMFLGNNLDIIPQLNRKYDAVYADMIYESLDLRWIEASFSVLKPNGIFIIQTDYHSVSQVKLFLDVLGLEFVNWCIYKQEWGGVPKKAFPRKHDDILIYANGKDYKWYGDRIQIAKKTAFTALDKKGTGLKTPCDVFDDLGNFSTLDKERVKMYDRNIQWQKPMKLMDRLLLPFTDEGDWILDPFSGSNTTGLWCKNNNRNYTGIELDIEVFKIGKERVTDYYVGVAE
jgi:adenine-specific DNA-methyltransferase